MGSWENFEKCFEVTDWKALCQPHTNAMTECVTDYINFCVESIIPIRTVAAEHKKKRKKGSY